MDTNQDNCLVLADEPISDNDFCSMDEETIRSLEIFKNNIDVNNRKQTVLGYLNMTKTSAGLRILKQNLRQPPADLPTIQNRLDCIETLTERPDALFTVQTALTRFGDIDLEQLVPSFVMLSTKERCGTSNLRMAEKRLDIVLGLRTAIQSVHHLSRALDHFDQPVINSYRQCLEDDARERIEIAIDDIVDLDRSSSKGKQKRSKIFAIREGVNSLFDVVRTTFEESIEDIADYVKTIQYQERLPFKLSYSTLRGYHLQLNRDHVNKNPDLPKYCLKVQTTRQSITCLTPELMRLNNRANLSYENSMAIGNDILTKLFQDLSPETQYLYKLVEIIGFLDMIVSFSVIVYSKNNALVRPTFHPLVTSVQGAYHPTLELCSNDAGITPNDIDIEANTGNVLVITGPNMGGKSVYLKQAALIQLFAQMGCYVPAEKAQLQIVTTIVVRCGCSDDFQSTCSSFMNEMKGVSAALAPDRREKSLIIIDELGRGTSVEDGAAYSFSVAEELSFRGNSLTLFATHFSMISCLEQLYSNIRFYRFTLEVNPRTGNLILTHRLERGLCQQQHYGIILAEHSDLPKEITEDARRQLNIAVSDSGNRE